MKEKIIEIQQYFKNKLLAGEFTILKMKENTCKIEIDGEYQFIIWIGNFIKYPELTRLYEYEASFMQLDMTEEERIILNSILKPAVLRYRKDTLIAQKQAELEKLISETNGE